MAEKLVIHEPIRMCNSYTLVPSLASLDKVGAGHDGIVYRYGDLVIKALKYDIDVRKTKGLMTFEKAAYFVNNLHLNRIAQPIDILLDSDGIYIGYVMRFFDDVTKDKDSPYYQTTGEFLMSDMYRSVNELEEDVHQLSSKRVFINDLNRGSYIYTKDHLIMCDMDKFSILHSSKNPTIHNINALSFFISKNLYYEMVTSGLFTKDELKQLIRWVKESSNSSSYLQDVRRDCLSDPNYPIGAYAREKGKMLVR